MQYNFNLIKPEPMDSLYPSMAGGSSSPMYPVGSPISPSNLHNLRQIRSPRRTPSPMGPSYSMQQPHTLTLQYHSPSGHASPNLPAQLMYNQSISLSRITPEPSQDIPGINHQGFQNPLVNADNVNNVLDLGINQCSFDINQLSGSLNPLDSDDLAVLGNAFAESFSSGLSLSDSQNKAQKIEPNAAGEGLNMTDSFTKLTNSTIQELCTLNNLYKPMQE